MAVEVATLIFKADSSDLLSLDKVLKEVENQAGYTQASAVALSKGIDGTGTAVSKMSRELAAMERQTLRAEAATRLTKEELKLYDLALEGASKEELDLASAMLHREAVAKASAATMAAAAAATTRAAQATASATRTVAASTTQAANSAVQSQAMIRGAMGNSRFAAQQLGYQISDVAVQLEMGTSALRVFGQQGSQIAASFGPAGIIVGAFIAVGSALANVFIPSLMDGKSAAEDLAEAMEELESVLKSEMGGTVQILTEDFVELAKYQRQAAEVELFSKQIAAAEALRMAQAELLDQTDSLKTSELRHMMARRSQMNSLIDDTGLTRQQIIMLNESFANLETGGVAAAQELQSKIKGILDTSSELTEEGAASLLGIYQSGQQMVAAGANADALNLSLDELLQKTADYNVILERNRVATGNANREREKQLSQQERINQQASDIAISLESEELQIKAAYEERRQIVLAANQYVGDAKLEILRKINEAELAEIAAHNQKLIDAELKKSYKMNSAWNDAQEWVSDRKRDNEKREVESRANFNSAMLSMSDSLFDNEQQKAKAAYNLAVNLMDKKKVENAKTIISDSHVAGMAAFRWLSQMVPIVGPALGAAAYAAAVGLGVSAAGKSMSGRALGGQVRAGESYVVGERGPEVLTMGSNGKIIPNDKIKSPPVSESTKNVNVSFNITANDARGFGQLLNSSRGQIIGMINQALNDQGRAGIA